MDSIQIARLPRISEDPIGLDRSVEPMDQTLSELLRRRSGTFELFDPGKVRLFVFAQGSDRKMKLVVRIPNHAYKDRFSPAAESQKGHRTDEEQEMA